MQDIPECQWWTVKAVLSASAEPGAKFLLQNLAEIEKDLAEKNYKKLLIRREGQQVVAIAGLTYSCFVLHVHFIYIVPAKRNTGIFNQLINQIKLIGRKQGYALVAVKCPDLDELNYVHNVFLDMAEHKVTENMTSGSQVTTYVIAKSQWEELFY